MNQSAAIILWRDNVGYVLEEHHNLTVESPTKIRLGEQFDLECTAIEYVNKPNFRWEQQHLLEVLIPWPTKVGYYKDKLLAAVPFEAVDSLHASMNYELSYTDVLGILKDLKHNALLDVSRSSFELIFHNVTVYVPLNTFIKILGPPEIKELKKISVSGLSFFQWTDQWVPLVEDTSSETKYIGVAQHPNGMWALPFTTAPKLVHQTPAQINDVLSHVVDLLQA